MSIFFFAILVYSICRTVWGKHLTLGTRQDKKKSKLEVDSPGHVGRLLQAPHPLVSDSNGLLSTEDMATKRPVVFIDVRGVKNEDRLIGLSMLRNLEMCSSSSRFLSSSSWCSSTAIFLLSFALFVWYKYAYVHQQRNFSIHAIFTVRWRGAAVTVWSSSAFWTNGQTFSSRRTTQVQWNPAFRIGPASVWSALAGGYIPKGRMSPLCFIFLSFRDCFSFSFSQEFIVQLQQQQKIQKNSVSLSPHHVPDKTLERHTCPCCFD